MAHHKRNRQKKARAGCLFCKPHKCTGKRNGDDAQRRQELRGRVAEREFLSDVRYERGKN
jgi:hypothetical protein